MTQTHLDDEEEAPLDPAAERVRKKLKRLLFISTATMGLGFLTVAFAIFYRLTADSDPSVSGTLPAQLTLSTTLLADERLVSADLQDDGLTLILDGSQGIRILVLDPTFGVVQQERLIPRTVD